MKDAQGHGSNSRGGSTTPQYAQRQAQRQISKGFAAHQSMVDTVGRAKGWQAKGSTLFNAFLKDKSGTGKDINEALMEHMTSRNPEDVHHLATHISESAAEGQPSWALGVHLLHALV